LQDAFGASNSSLHSIFLNTPLGNFNGENMKRFLIDLRIRVGERVVFGIAAVVAAMVCAWAVPLPLVIRKAMLPLRAAA
jgi:hypothetical protein